MARRELNEAAFCAALPDDIFGGPPSALAMAHIRAILGYWTRSHAMAPLAQLAYVLATVRAEVGRDMAPVRETFARDDAEARTRLADKPYAASCGPQGHAYYGRGYVQLTWAENYRAAGAKLGVPLEAEPDRALEPDLALRLLVEGMLDGDYNPSGAGLGAYITPNGCDFVGARNTVNLQNRAAAIAQDAEAFLAALRAGGWEDEDGGEDL